MSRLDQHEKDTDCTVDPETMICTVCLVDHSDPCPDCKGRGFHRPTCYWMSPVLLTEVAA
jgi:hypothetical protein